MKTITVTSEKGGTGKTTIAVHLAGLLAQRGRRVLLIDADPQGHATISLGLSNAPGLYNLLVRRMTWAEVLQTAADGLRVLPGNEETYAIPQLISDADAFAAALHDLDAVDVVIIDTAPTPGLLMSLLYMATDAVIIPTLTEYLSLDGLVKTVGRVQHFQRRSIAILGIVPNLYQKSTALHKQNLSNLMDYAGAQDWPVWSPLAARTIWREASQQQQLVTAMKPGSAAAVREIMGVVEQVEGWLHG